MYFIIVFIIIVIIIVRPEPVINDVLSVTGRTTSVPLKSCREPLLRLKPDTRQSLVVSRRNMTARLENMRSRWRTLTESTLIFRDLARVLKLELRFV